MSLLVPSNTGLVAPVDAPDPVSGTPRVIAAARTHCPMLPWVFVLGVLVLAVMPVGIRLPDIGSGGHRQRCLRILFQRRQGCQPGAFGAVDTFRLRQSSQPLQSMPQVGVVRLPEDRTGGRDHRQALMLHQEPHQPAAFPPTGVRPRSVPPPAAAPPEPPPAPAPRAAASDSRRAAIDDNAASALPITQQTLP